MTWRSLLQRLQYQSANTKSVGASRITRVTNSGSCRAQSRHPGGVTVEWPRDSSTSLGMTVMRCCDKLKSAPAKYAILFFSCVLFHILGTWSLPLVDRDEPRFAEASREMIKRSNYVVPYFNNQLRLDKPPLTYWAQVASYRIFGENDFAARFPSAIAAALTAVSILAWGKRVGGERVRWRAAIIFTLSLQVFIHAKAAVADMWLVLFVTTAHWAGWELMESKQTSNTQRRTPNAEWMWWWAFYVSLALGFLAKGAIAWVPLLTEIGRASC